jgi:hypothetical protein
LFVFFFGSFLFLVVCLLTRPPAFLQPQPPPGVEILTLFDIDKLLEGLTGHASSKFGDFEDA